MRYVMWGLVFMALLKCAHNARRQPSSSSSLLAAHVKGLQIHGLLCDFGVQQGSQENQYTFN